MQWTDEGVIIGTRRHGESSLIVELMTLGHGRHLGLVRGGRSRRHLPSLQIGNSVSATWRARLHEHLGSYAIELTRPRAARLIDEPASLYAAQCLAALARLLPERDPHGELYQAFCAILDLPDAPLLSGAMLVRFEMRLLEELGFGLDLDACAANGEGELVYVSPKSGRAVSRAAGAPYHGRLLALPAFLAAPPSGKPPPADDVLAGFELTGYFLTRHVYEPRGLVSSDARRSLMRLIDRAAPVTDEE